MRRVTLYRTLSTAISSSRKFPFHDCVSKNSFHSASLLAHVCRPSSHPMSTISADHPNANFFRYTSGRWLWDEEQQLRDRFTPFNVSELQRVAARSVGANSCDSMTKLAEGSFNKTFRLVMDNGSAVIARIPYPIAGPKYYTTASEVATMDFVGLPKPYASNFRYQVISKTITGSHCAANTCSTGTCLERPRR